MSAITSGLDAFAPAHQMLAALEQRLVSSRELVELHLSRIERYNPALNAVVVPGIDPRAAAEQADAKRSQGSKRALLGLPGKAGLSRSGPMGVDSVLAPRWPGTSATRDGPSDVLRFAYSAGASWQASTNPCRPLSVMTRARPSLTAIKVAGVYRAR